MRILLFVAVVGVFFQSFYSINAFKLLSRGKRLAGGKNSSIEEFTYLVALEKDSQFYCSGAIISPKHILTAAHCFYGDIDPSSYQVRSGSSFSEESGIVHQVCYITIHENYKENDPNVYFDLAVIELEDPIELDNKTRRFIRMFNPGEETKGGSGAVTAGWGRATEDGPLSNQLISVEMNIVDKHSCNVSWNWDPEEVYAIQDQICASSADGSQSICAGDSGGPLIVDGKIAGVTSTSSADCRSQPLPNIFTEVASYREWIDDVVRKENEIDEVDSISDFVQLFYHKIMKALKSRLPIQIHLL